jgi:hypothetical protein
MNIKETFLKLTSETYPHGTESGLFHLLPSGLHSDEFGNLYIQLGESPNTMFTSHLDTASSDKRAVNHIFEGNLIKTDGTSILGADDKAGVTIMLYLIEKGIPGLYYFFLGEERGCIGSKAVAKLHRENPLPNIKKVISFDRRGTGSVITFQSSSRCCSETFAEALSMELNRKSKVEDTILCDFNYSADPTGVYTDSYQFMSIYPECTNISVGYQNEHTGRETQDILHLEKLCKVASLVDWEGLPVERDQKICEGRSRYSYYNDLGDDIWEYNYRSFKKEKKKNWFIDEEFDNHVSYIEVDSSGEVSEVDMSRGRIEREKNEISEFLRETEIEFSGMSWNGMTLEVEHTEKSGEHCTKINRSELGGYLEILNFWKSRKKNEVSV